MSRLFRRLFLFDDCISFAEVFNTFVENSVQKAQSILLSIL